MRLDLDLNIDWMYENTRTHIKYAFSPFFVKDANGNPFVYIVVSDRTLENANANKLIF